MEVTNIDTVEFGKATTLECNVIAVRGITSSVNIGWLISTGYNYSIVRTVEDVTANIVNNSAVYTDQLVTSPLSVNDSGRVYYCVVSINSTFGISILSSVVLDFTGKYVRICMYLRMYVTFDILFQYHLAM